MAAVRKLGHGSRCWCGAFIDCADCGGARKCWQPCREKTECACGEEIECGDRNHVHPLGGVWRADGEYQLARDRWAAILWGPPIVNGQPSIFRGHPGDGPCVICERPAEVWVGADTRACEDCATALHDPVIVAGIRAFGGPLERVE